MGSKLGDLLCERGSDASQSAKLRFPEVLGGGVAPCGSGNAYDPTHTVGICYMWKVIDVMGSKFACRGVFEALIVPLYSFPFRENPLA